MLEEKRYTLGELTSFLSGSTNEFNPRLGDGVEKEDKKNNEKAVSVIMKETEKMAPKSKKKDITPENTRDMNGKTSDYRFVAEPDKTYKDRNEALRQGYSSPLERDNGIDKSADFDGNKRIDDVNKELSDKREKVRYAKDTSGLKTKEEVDKSDEIDDMHKSKTMYKESLKRLHFKNTKFLSEAHMMKKIPDEYKYDGNRFLMKDSEGTEYLVECHIDDEYKNVSLNVVSKTNKGQIMEELERMRSLYNYDRSDYSSNALRESRNNGDEKFINTFKAVRDIEEK